MEFRKLDKIQLFNNKNAIIHLHRLIPNLDPIEKDRNPDPVQSKSIPKLISGFRRSRAARDVRLRRARLTTQSSPQFTVGLGGGTRLETQAVEIRRSCTWRKQCSRPLYSYNRFTYSTTPDHFMAWRKSFWGWWWLK